MKYTIPSQKDLLAKRETRAAITMARHHQLMRDVRANRKAELDRIRMALIGNLSPGLRQKAFLFRRKKMLEELVKDSVT